MMAAEHQLDPSRAFYLFDRPWRYALVFRKDQPTEGEPWSLEVESVPAPSPPKTLLSAVVSGALDAVKAVIAHMERRASTHIS
jgi:hypothetical protein